MCPEERSRRKFLHKMLCFCQMLPGIEGKYFGLLGKLFPARLSSFRSTFAEEGCREKFLERKSFFIVSRLEAKNRLLKEHQDENQNFILRARWILFRKNILFKVTWYISSGFSSKKNMNFEKNFRRLVKIAFYMSRGTSRWNYFCSLKTFFLKVFGLRVKTFSLIFLGMFLETASYVAGGPFDYFFSDFVISFLLCLDFEHKIFTVLIIFFQQVRQKCILRVRRKVLREYTSFEETCYLYRFSQTFTEFFSNFHKKLAWF